MSQHPLPPPVASEPALLPRLPPCAQDVPVGPSRPKSSAVVRLKTGLLNIISKELQVLEPRDRQLLALSLGAQLSSEEIAEFLAWPAEAVSQSLARLRHRLGRRLGPHFAAPEAEGGSQEAEFLVTAALLASFPPPPDLYHKVLARLQAREQVGNRATGFLVDANRSEDLARGAEPAVLRPRAVGPPGR